MIIAYSGEDSALQLMRRRPGRKEELPTHERVGRDHLFPPATCSGLTTTTWAVGRSMTKYSMA